MQNMSNNWDWDGILKIIYVVFAFCAALLLGALKGLTFIFVF